MSPARGQALTVNLSESCRHSLFLMFLFTTNMKCVNHSCLFVTLFAVSRQAGLSVAAERCHHLRSHVGLPISERVLQNALTFLPAEYVTSCRTQFAAYKDISVYLDLVRTVVDRCDNQVLWCRDVQLSSSSLREGCNRSCGNPGALAQGSPQDQERLSFLRQESNSITWFSCPGPYNESLASSGFGRGWFRGVSSKRTLTHLIHPIGNTALLTRKGVG